MDVEDCIPEGIELNHSVENGALICNNNEECTSIGLSPVQIQQEYFENLGDGDWVK